MCPPHAVAVFHHSVIGATQISKGGRTHGSAPTVAIVKDRDARPIGEGMRRRDISSLPAASAR